MLGALDALSQPADHPQLLLFIAVAQQRAPTLDQPPESLLITAAALARCRSNNAKADSGGWRFLGMLALDHADHPLALMLGDVALTLQGLKPEGV